MKARQARQAKYTADDKEEKSKGKNSSKRPSLGVLPLVAAVFLLGIVVGSAANDGGAATAAQRDSPVARGLRGSAVAPPAAEAPNEYPPPPAAPKPPPAAAPPPGPPAARRPPPRQADWMPMRPTARMP